MKKNKLLSIAIIICKSIRALYILVFLLLTGLFIHLQISPESYKQTHIKNLNTYSSFSLSKSSSWIMKGAAEEKNVFTLDKISKTTLYINYLKFSVVLIFMFLATKEFQKIMESVKNLKTFQNNNVVSFRKIGKYIFIVFLLTSFTNLQFEEGGKSEINLSFTPLLFMLFAFIMAEIFKEGNSLKQENDLTI